MAILDLEKQEIIKQGSFLEKIGFRRTNYEYMINYTSDNISICVAFPPCIDESDITIRYTDTNQVFSVNWIAFVRNKIDPNIKRLKRIKILLSYMEDNITNLLNYQYCLESNKLVEKYVEEHRQIFDKAVSDFLSKN